MGVEITTQVAGEAAGAQRELQALAAEFGVSFHPLHPDTDDPRLSSYFIVEVPDAAQVPRVLDRLRRSPVFSAAYVKPPDAMP
jgi:hypothetical protein